MRACISEVIENGRQLLNEMKRNDHHRDKSWEHCYLAFAKYQGSCKELNDCEMESLCLHLAFYLASFRMYRASSFLFHLDYKVHTNAVHEILKPEYEKLWAVTCKDYLDNETLLRDLFLLTEKLREIYANVRAKAEGDKLTKSPISDILLTKILMGTLGCTPAYDKFFRKCARNTLELKSANYKKDSFEHILKYYDDNCSNFEALGRDVSYCMKMDYPQMRILDMCFCTTGYQIALEEKQSLEAF